MKMTQEQRLINYLSKHKNIDRVRAYRTLGIANLTAVVAEARKHGNNIVSTDKKHINKWGEKTSYCLYSLNN